MTTLAQIGENLTRQATHGERLAALRVPFAPEKIGKLPKSQIKSEDYKALPKAHCNVCGGYHPATATIHLDFVGHADVTERLLDVDPAWNWEPMGVAPDGLPMMILNGAGAPIGLWIKLTVCGVTRIGFGSVTPGAFDAEKQLIGDALRNAAMRFGVALDLWRKDAPDAPVEAPTRPRAAEGKAKVKVVSREATGRVCPDCGGDLELITWDNGSAATCCANWKEKDGGCKHREATIPDALLPEPIHDPSDVPF